MPSSDLLRLKELASKAHPYGLPTDDDLRYLARMWGGLSIEQLPDHGQGAQDGCARCLLADRIERLRQFFDLCSPDRILGMVEDALRWRFILPYLDHAGVLYNYPQRKYSSCVRVGTPFGASFPWPEGAPTPPPPSALEIVDAAISATRSLPGGADA